MEDRVPVADVKDWKSPCNNVRGRNARKRVKPFDPAEVARLCPIVREAIVMGE